MASMTRESVLRPGMFGVAACADSRRYEFDSGNEELLLAGIRPDVVFIGDSITHLWELQAYFGGTGSILINRGIGGDNSTHVRQRFSADVLQLHPRLAVLKIGTNDLGWNLEQFTETMPNTICENITAIAIDAQAAGVPLAICSLLPIWGPSWYPVPGYAEKKNAQIIEINTRLRAITADHGAFYVDYYAQMIDANGMLQHDLADDGIHPHAYGYTIMARVLREKLAEMGITF